VEAQRRMRKASILFCGFSALNAEVCKNLVLAGVSVTLLDNETVVKEDIDAHLFLQAGDIGEKVRFLVYHLVTSIYMDL